MVEEAVLKIVGRKRFGGSSPSHIVRIAPQKRCYPLIKHGLSYKRMSVDGLVKLFMRIVVIEERS